MTGCAGRSLPLSYRPVMRRTLRRYWDYIAPGVAALDVVCGRNQLTGWDRPMPADRPIRGLWSLPGAGGDWRWILP